MSEPAPTRIGEYAQLACVLDVAAPKAGNVHLRAAFENINAADFLVSAMVTAPILDQAPDQPLGRTILDAVRATVDAVGMNTNLGIVLLLAPLCKAGLEGDLRTRVATALEGLTMDDARDVYEAIRIANPRGLGSAAEHDVHDEPSVPLIEAMSLAAERGDAVARQYVNGFADVFDRVLPDLEAALAAGLAYDEAMVLAHLKQMAREPDGLVRRKCGEDVARQVQARAAAVVDGDWPRGDQSGARFAAFDTWLRSENHERNPGTSADLVVAGVYAAQRLGRWRVPCPWAASLLEGMDP